MNELRGMINVTESLKDELITLNSVYDELFKPWILITPDSPLKEDVSEINVNSKTKDLDLLYKLRNVLTEASVRTKSSIKTITRIPEKKILEKIKPVSNSKKNIDVSNTVSKQRLPIVKNRPRSTSCNRVFIPAHMTAPFKTDPNIHKPKSSINYSISRRVPTPSTSTTSSIASNSHRSRNNLSNIAKPGGVTMSSEVVQGSVVSVTVTEERENDGGVSVDASESLVMSQLREDIRILEEAEVTSQEALSTEEGAQARSHSSMTIVEAGSRLQVPRLIAKSCSAHRKWQAMVDRSLLENMRPDTASAGYKARQKFLEAVLRRRGRMAVDDHRAVVLDAVLDKVLHVCASLDLPSCNAIQLCFLRGCLALALTQYDDIQTRATSSISTNKVNDRSLTGAMRQWISARSSSSVLPPLSKVWYQDTMSITNGGLISAHPAAHCHRGSVPSLAVTRPPSRGPFTFSVQGTIADLWSAIPVTVHLVRSRHIAMEMRIQLCLGSLLSCWADQLQDRYQNGDNPCAFYRQLYGLLMHKYPVLLRDVS